jgi:hypothetical protein
MRKFRKIFFILVVIFLTFCLILDGCAKTTRELPRTRPSSKTNITSNTTSSFTITTTLETSTNTTKSTPTTSVILTTGTISTWIRNIGGEGDEVGYSVQQTTDGGYVITGSTEPNPSTSDLTDLYLIKTDAQGKVIWSRTFGGGLNDGGKSVQQTSDGGFIVIGYTYDYDLNDYFVYFVKTNSAGIEEWHSTVGKGASCSSGLQTKDGGYIAVGDIFTPGAGYPDVYLVKTDSKGQLLWDRTFGGKYGEGGLSVQQTKDGGFIIAGFSSTPSSGQEDDIYLIKTDSTGNELWSRTFIKKGIDHASSVKQTQDGGYIVVGDTERPIEGWSDVYLIKTDSEGKEVWSRTFGESRGDFGNSVQQTKDGGYIVAGLISDTVTNYVYLIKTDSEGRELWSRTSSNESKSKFGWGTFRDSANSVQLTDDGGYIVVGQCDPADTSRRDDVFLIKTDSDGRVSIK